MRNPAAYDRLREEVRGRRRGRPTPRRGDDPREDAHAAGDPDHRAARHGAVAARRPRAAGVRDILSRSVLHHREDVYPDPFAFRPERFLGVKPGTYTWIPFGGGIRRCLGAALAMAEQRIVLRAIARRTDLAALDPSPEHARTATSR